jgi:hypothetical protein
MDCIHLVLFCILNALENMWVHFSILINKTVSFKTLRLNYNEFQTHKHRSTYAPDVNPGSREGYSVHVSYKTPVVLLI